MGRNIEVQTQALTSLSRDYKIYGQNVYSRYKTGSSRIERELESILRKYAEYGSVTSKARSIQSKLREIERQAKEIEARSSKLSQGLSNVAASYKEDEAQSKRIIDTQKLSVDKISNKTTNIKVAVKLDSQLTASEVGKTVATATKIAIDKIGDIAEGTIEKIKNSSVVSNIKGISKKVSNTLSNIKTSISNTVTNIGTKVSEVATGIKKTVVNFTSAVKDKWESLKSSVKSFTKKTKDFVCDVGKKIAEGLTGTFNKFKEVAQTAIEYIKDKKDIILDTLKKVGIKILDGIQFLLDLAGLIPGIGEIADAINGGIYTLRGDALNAALSFAACIPFAGWAATGGKIGGKIVKFVSKLGDVGKLIDKVKDFAKYFDKVKDLGKTVMKYGDNVIDFLKRKGDDIWSFISKNKVVNKATELVSKLSKVGYDLQGYLIKQVDKVSVSLGEWWIKQAQVGILPKEIAELINRKGGVEVLKEVGDRALKEGAEEVSEKLAMEAIEKKIEKEIKEEAIEYKNCINKFNTIKEQWVDDEKAQEFISTLDKYAEQAVDMKACDSKIEFYQMYQNREYKYSQEFIEEIKKQYLESGASAIVNQKDVEFAFSRFETIGRGKYGNFVTSIKEDSNLLYDDFGRLHKGSVIESIKGVDPGKYDSGIYQYKYDTELVESFNKLGIIRTADGTTPGASSLNIPGCQTWAGKNIGYSESELIMPSIDVSEFDSSEVFNSIKENGFFEIKNPTIISPDGSKVQVNGSFKIEKLGE